MEAFTSVIAGQSAPGKRDVKKVPFVELLGGRVQGVVSSGSDVRRVYVSFVEGGTGNFYCCTNNNRPCGGMYGSSCKHLQLMVQEAVLQFGASTVAKYLGLKDPESFQDGSAMLASLNGSLQKESPGIVFSRFLNYLRYCELKCPPGTVHEMAWFVS
jgi:hypothetical protein